MSLTQTQKENAIHLASQGLGLPKIRDAIGVDQKTFWEFRQADSEFALEFARARQEGLEELADGLLTITETETDVQKARLHSDNVRWILSKRKPHVYGDRIDVNVNQTVDIRAAIEDGRKRAALPISYQHEVLDAQAIDIAALPSAASPDSQSDDAPASPVEEIDPFS